MYLNRSMQVFDEYFVSQNYITYIMTVYVSLFNKSKMFSYFSRYFCFFLSGLRAGLAASIAGSSIISKMLLANIDPFGATPFIDPDPDSL